MKYFCVCLLIYVYQAQGIVPEEEWDTFVDILKKPLPTTFRITEHSNFADEVKKRLEEVRAKGPIKLDDDTFVQPLEPLPWYPNNGGWNFPISRKGLKKNSELEAFHRFLTLQTESVSFDQFSFCGNSSFKYRATSPDKKLLV
jgi:multisite-specific tRNA:(cytosine-C5)-methyltransferase